MKRLWIGKVRSAVSRRAASCNVLREFVGGKENNLGIDYLMTMLFMNGVTDGYTRTVAS